MWRQQVILRHLLCRKPTTKPIQADLPHKIGALVCTVPRLASNCVPISMCSLAVTGFSTKSNLHLSLATTALSLRKRDAAFIDLRLIRAIYEVGREIV